MMFLYQLNSKENYKRFMMILGLTRKKNIYLYTTEKKQPKQNSFCLNIQWALNYSEYYTRVWKK